MGTAGCPNFGFTIKFSDEAKIDMKYLKEILQKYNLNEKFEHFMKLYYGKSSSDYS